MNKVYEDYECEETKNYKNKNMRLSIWSKEKKCYLKNNTILVVILEFKIIEKELMDKIKEY